MMKSMAIVEKTAIKVEITATTQLQGVPKKMPFWPIFEFQTLGGVFLGVNKPKMAYSPDLPKMAIIEEGGAP